MAARNGPNTVEGQLKRKPNEVHSRQTGTTNSSCTVESARPVSLPGARSEDGRGFVSAFLKPSGESRIWKDRPQTSLEEVVVFRYYKVSHLVFVQPRSEMNRCLKETCSEHLCRKLLSSTFWSSSNGTL
ncbi:hypothetical protein AVEN_213488-1 [Araneus ventricosus]|uniref:Uncharacterized protein n=1 Tax=Araneus ventricosus TaxID=182803 RepID=A0A4Y2NPI7_ARAVE|nr:hypothetical protein AVEN_213488-1 [Araneus ventricosus]